MIGQVLGHCRVVAKIGEGGMGVVYRAHDEVLHRDVALKVVNKRTGLDASASQNLLHEARASSSLAHPNICTIYEVGETEGDLYIVMELVEGKSLCAMSGDGGLPAESVLRYGVQIASALARAIMGTAHARPATKKSLRDCFARCHDRGFIRSGWNLLRHAQRADLWFAR